MTINCKGNLIDLSTPKVMGILNVTPNSFYDGGKYDSEDKLLLQVEKMLNEGATFIDIGGYSTKPNACEVSETEELNRVVGLIEKCVQNFPEILISIDTFRSKVAQEAIAAGASLINDVSAGNLDKTMMQTVADLQVPYIMMHMKGNPKTMQSLTNYDNLLKEMLFYFSEKIAQARSFGINDLIVDLGFGFAKTTEQNFELLKSFEIFNQLDLPILVGISRKSMIYKSLDISVEESLNATTALNMFCLEKGTKILRVHDVKEAVECVKLYNLITK